MADSCLDFRQLSSEEVLETSISGMAYIGDAVYELYVRRRLFDRYSGASGALHGHSVSYVSAKNQAAALKYLEPRLGESESNLVRRARNHQNKSMPRHASIGDYRLATAFEALIGSLWLSGAKARLTELIVSAFEYLEELELAAKAANGSNKERVNEFSVLQSPGQEAAVLAEQVTEQCDED